MSPIHHLGDKTEHFQPTHLADHCVMQDAVVDFGIWGDIESAAFSCTVADHNHQGGLFEFLLIGLNNHVGSDVVSEDGPEHGCEVHAKPLKTSDLICVDQDGGVKSDLGDWVRRNALVPVQRPQLFGFEGIVFWDTVLFPVNHAVGKYEPTAQEIADWFLAATKSDDPRSVSIASVSETFDITPRPIALRGWRHTKRLPNTISLTIELDHATGGNAMVHDLKLYLEAKF